MKMKILIIEDDFSFAVDIEIGLKALGYSDIIIIDNSKLVLDTIRKEQPELLIIDVNLNDDLTGIEIANQLNPQNIPVIFITALRDEHTFQEAMQANPSAFLVKPFDKVTLQSCIDRVIKKSENVSAKKSLKSMLLDDCFFIKQNDVLKRIEFDDILWIEADGNYIVIHVDDKRYVAKMSLTRVQKKMSVPYFVRVHKKFLINIKKIETLNSTTELEIKGKAIPIGSKYRLDLLEVIKSVDY